MKAMLLAAHAERLQQFLVQACLDERITITTTDEITAATFADILTDLQAATDDFLGNTYEKDLPN